jgi:hypothetical protein
MATVDLVYSSDCPNVTLARANLLLAFARAGVKPKWSEHRAATSLGSPRPRRLAAESTKAPRAPCTLLPRSRSWRR